ncbi:two pore domain potassium channel family protein [Aquabacter sp. L1I39]|uniref:potassium channel family protein n=1 Tax=Aquabacter sp. L1I39 TaxID=2820278 RepID=UPI001ADA481A|nr:potassium channel family protein [Aquabacter sp. L1I39]QTL04852.1 two pore domain potassium channel family protein [Aquabacter sp. L1I39]
MITLELWYGLIVSLINIALQAIATVATIRLLRVASTRLTAHRKVATLMVVMMMTAAVLTLAHIIQVRIWALSYVMVGAVAHAQNAFYLAFVNFTTLGYGDILPSPDWRILGPLTAANGMLLFGWSTALMFAVLSRVLRLLRIN